MRSIPALAIPALAIPALAIPALAIPALAIPALAGRTCPRRSFWITSAGGVAAALVFVSIAHAQLLNPFPGYRGPVMNDQDMKLARSALQTLLNQEPATAGKTETWSNPADGRHGSLTMAGSFRYNHMDCRTVHSSVSYPDWATPRKFTFKLCRTPQGEWKTL
jgi:surface antigen